MKLKCNLTAIVVSIFGLTFFLNNNALSQGNSGGNANSNNNANGNALKWETQGNNADTSHFIGTTNPTALKMRTNNKERMRITKDGKFGIGISNPLEKLEIQGNLKLTGDVIFKGYEELQYPSDRFIMIDKTGKTTPLKKNIMKAYMSLEDCYDIEYELSLVGESGGATIIAAGTYPDWAKRIEGTKSIIYTGTDCPAWVGIGTDLPDARLDVKGDARFSNGVRIGSQDGTETALHIENRYIGSGKNMFDKLIVVEDHENKKILQLENNGLLRAREIKVDQETWADYVFEEEYPLMPLKKVKEFIAQNGHLPNVPSAKEIETGGVNLGETARVTMEKVEELTLYAIQLQEALEKQQELIEKQQEILEAQQKELDALKKQ